MNKVQLILLTAIMLSMAACGPRGEQGRSIKGDPGDTVVGPPGAPGNDGRDGIDGEIGQLIQLCPGTSNYGTFIEYAICSEGSLYAVYSVPGAFFTYLAPGRYSSQGIGSACSFTVLPNCEIQP